jgi:hypothetical protein
MTDAEIWKPVPSLPGVEASSWGRLRTAKVEVKMPRGGYCVRGGKPTRGGFNKAVQRYRFRWDGRSYVVARLICEAFHGPPPFPDARALHEDEDSTNDRPANLRWGTQKQNLNYPGFLAYCRGRTGDDSAVRKGQRRRLHTPKPMEQR